MFYFIGEWATVQCSELHGIKAAVGGMTTCVKQFVELQKSTAKVNSTLYVYTKFLP